MRKYSLPVRVAALLCALCLLLTGCGTVAAPDDSGDTSTPAPTAEPAAAAAPATDETELTTEDAELTEVEKLAAQLAAQLTAEAAYAWLVIAHTSPGQHYPNVFDDQNAVYAIPEGVEYELLHQETGSNCYILKEYPLDKSQLDWTTFGEP